MILLVHLLLGAAIGQKINNPFLAIILAFSSHYFLDFIPHVDYSLENAEKKGWRKFLPTILKISLDFCLGILLIFFFSKNYPIIYVCAFFAILPDGFTVLTNFFPNNKILKWHDNLHTGKIHFLKNKKIPNYWRILSQVFVVILVIALFRF